MGWYWLLIISERRNSSIMNFFLVSFKNSTDKLLKCDCRGSLFGISLQIIQYWLWRTVDLWSRSCRCQITMILIKIVGKHRSAPPQAASDCDLLWTCTDHAQVQVAYSSVADWDSASHISFMLLICLSCKMQRFSILSAMWKQTLKILFVTN